MWLIHTVTLGPLLFQSNETPKFFGPPPAKKGCHTRLLYAFVMFVTPSLSIYMRIIIRFLGLHLMIHHWNCLWIVAEIWFEMFPVRSTSQVAKHDLLQRPGQVQPTEWQGRCVGSTNGAWVREIQTNCGDWSWISNKLSPKKNPKLCTWKFGIPSKGWMMLSSEFEQQ